MKFQILDANGVAISINEIDETVANFWGIEINQDYYAKKNGINWFDVIGYAIANTTDKNWYEVIKTICSIYLMPNIHRNKENNTYFVEGNNLLSSIEPFIEVINHFILLGYKPA